MNSHNHIIRQFQVTELEERVEFKGWKGEAEAGYSEKDGAYTKATLTKEW
jgi:hypothetical protein